MFLDEIIIEAEGGKGGDGCMSFRREKYVPRGGPDGGDGGNGGSVILRVDSSYSSLIHLSQRKLWKAENGKPGSGAQRHGASAEDFIIPVPVGTVVYDQTHHFVLKDLTSKDEEMIAAHGGAGGKGNARFKTAINRAPRTTTPGEEGEHRVLRLELKVIADVGMIGKPNAGKSTLLSCVSRARPEIASYPFTTKYPNLGLVQSYTDRTFILADIPGLIEGAHAGHGLGHDFLKHIQRSGILVHLIEPVPDDGTDPLKNYMTIRNELELFDPKLKERSEIIVVSKADIPEAAETQRKLAGMLGKEVHKISAVTGEGVADLIRVIQHQLSPAADW
ncbi:MAG: GTPase ObgE [Planctomycetaceae bacterium]|jgi:GTP-binding protein|nr:GTPase ObgE [Planctomycetaceae bacterium]